MATFDDNLYPLYITIYLTNTLSTGVTLNSIGHANDYNDGQPTLLPNGGSATLVYQLLGPCSGSFVYNITDTEVATITYQTTGGPGSFDNSVTLTGVVNTGTTYVVNGENTPNVQSDASIGSWYTFNLSIATS